MDQVQPSCADVQQGILSAAVAGPSASFDNALCGPERSAGYLISVGQASGMYRLRVTAPVNGVIITCAPCLDLTHAWSAEHHPNRCQINLKFYSIMCDI